jgi:hypothetical protein
MYCQRPLSDLAFIQITVVLQEYRYRYLYTATYTTSNRLGVGYTTSNRLGVGYTTSNRLGVGHRVQHDTVNRIQHNAIRKQIRFTLGH